jgi:hypothetical protein
MEVRVAFLALSVAFAIAVIGATITTTRSVETKQTPTTLFCRDRFQELSEQRLTAAEAEILSTETCFSFSGDLVRARVPMPASDRGICCLSFAAR